MIFLRRLGGGYAGEHSIFDNIKENDIVIAFFPCIRFSTNAVLLMGPNGYNSPNNKNLDDIAIIQKSMTYNVEQSELYQLFSMLFIIAYRHNIKMIVENPATQPHYLSHYFPIKSTLIDSDRRRFGDAYKKPTQYWFVNCKPKYNFYLINLRAYDRDWKTIKQVRGIKRSLITSDYANNFIKTYILQEEEKE